MNRKTELENAIADLIKRRQATYRLRHDVKIAILKGDKHEWLPLTLEESAKDLQRMNRVLRSLREELKGL